MRIAIFSDHFYPELGGIQDSLEELARELGRRGHTVHIWAPRASARDFALVGRPVSEIELGDTVHVHRVPAMPFPFSPTQQSRIALPYFIPDREALAACNVIHTNSFFGVGLTALRAARIYAKPLVGTNHWAFAEFGDYLPASLAKKFSAWAIRYVNWYYSHCDYMTAPGFSTISEEIRNGFTVPHEAISNPIDTDTFHPATTEERVALRERFGFTGPIIACVGRLAIEKKDDIVLRAFGLLSQHVPDAELVFAGHGIFEGRLRELATELQVAEKVRFLGTLHKHDLADLMRASDVYAIASTSETQSMSLLQAFASGLPAVGVNWRAIPEYLSPDRGALFPKDDHAKMADELERLLHDATLRKQQGDAAQAYVQEFSIPAIAAGWERIYSSIIVRASAPTQASSA